MDKIIDLYMIEGYEIKPIKMFEESLNNSSLILELSDRFYNKDYGHYYFKTIDAAYKYLHVELKSKLTNNMKTILDIREELFKAGIENQNILTAIAKIPDEFKE